MESNSSTAPASLGHPSSFFDRNMTWLAVLVSVSLHFASVAIMHWKDSNREPIIEKATVTKVRILSNPNGNPNITQTKVVEIAKPKPKPKKKTTARAIVKDPPKEEPAPAEEEVANNLPQSFGDDPTGGMVGTGTSNTDGTDGISANAEPIERVNPEFPEEARLKGIEGWVLVRFDITEDGRVENVEVVDASPRNMFERDARKAVKKWKYAPRMSNGQPVRVVGREVQVDFKLAG